MHLTTLDPIFATERKLPFISFIVAAPTKNRFMKKNFDTYRIRREVIARKIDALCDRFDQLATYDPEREQLLCHIEALNIAYNAED